MLMMFDAKLMRPGCVLLQAAYGCGEASHAVMRFHTETWLVSITDDLKKYEFTDQQVDKLIEHVNAQQEKKTDAVV